MPRDFKTCIWKKKKSQIKKKESGKETLKRLFQPVLPKHQRPSEAATRMLLSGSLSTFRLKPDICFLTKLAVAAVGPGLHGNSMCLHQLSLSGAEWEPHRQPVFYELQEKQSTGLGKGLSGWRRLLPSLRMTWVQSLGLAVEWENQLPQI